MREGRIGRLARQVVWAQEGLAGVALVVMMLAVVLDVALRHLTGHPLRGSYDVVSFTLLVVVYFGIGGVILRGAEISIDLLDALLPARVLAALKLIAMVLTLATMAFATWAMIGPALDSHRYGDRSLELGLPVWWLWVAAFIGIAGICIAALARLLLEWSVVLKPGDEGMEP